MVTRLLEEHCDVYNHEAFSQANLRTFGICIRGTVEELSIMTKEFSIDATFGTNNAGMDMYALLTELDGNAVFLAYHSLERNFSNVFTVP